MKKNILTVAIAAAMLGLVATGCSSTKQGGSGADSAATDSSTMTAPADSAATPMTDSAATPTDTTKTDTTKKP